MYLLLDIDGTYSDDAWREPFAINDGWDDYHAQLERDEPIEEMFALVRGLRFAGWQIHCVTARPEKWRTQTMRWMVRQGAPVERILMRADKDFRASPDVKKDLILNNFTADQLKKAVAIDDREDVCLAYRAMGLVALQVHRNPPR